MVFQHAEAWLHNFNCLHFCFIVFRLNIRNKRQTDLLIRVIIFTEVTFGLFFRGSFLEKFCIFKYLDYQMSRSHGNVLRFCFPKIWRYFAFMGLNPIEDCGGWRYFNFKPIFVTQPLRVVQRRNQTTEIWCGCVLM